VFYYCEYRASVQCVLTFKASQQDGTSDMSYRTECNQRCGSSGGRSYDALHSQAGNVVLQRTAPSKNTRLEMNARLPVLEVSTPNSRSMWWSPINWFADLQGHKFCSLGDSSFVSHRNKINVVKTTNLRDINPRRNVKTDTRMVQKRRKYTVLNEFIYQDRLCSVPKSACWFLLVSVR
jgi:hypothetical protein